MLLEVQGLQAAYGDVQALWDVSFAVEEGELVALLGANGAGKTTTLRAVTGLLPPRRGRISFADQPIHREPAHRIATLGVAHVPEGRQLFPLMSVEDNLLLGSYPPRARASRRRNLDRVYERFPRLYERRRQDAGTLSGGEQQMLAIGRALMSEPRLLVLDEPSLGLAPVVVQELFGVVREVASSGTTVLLVEQSVHHALAIADRAYVLENGRVVMEGTGRALLDEARIQSAYLGL
ncbi:MAG: ABC transporter ATP-binding protein [Firmicutes bacterium]|nr:ABC transporter ATP-binding protein [Bacillota bacterium]